jgi:hypothetical protein
VKLSFYLSAAILSTAVVSLFATVDRVFPDISVKEPFGGSKPNKTSSTQILYHGGPVMNQTNSVYVIYYGTAFASTTQSIINDFLVGLSGSTQYGVNGTYNQGANTPGVPPTYVFAAPTGSPGPQPSGSVYWDNYSQGTQLNNGSIPKIVANAIGSGLTYNVNGVYLVITSPDVKISGFCTSFCAYHTATNVTLASGGSAHLRYALIPDPTQRCSGCNGGVALYQDVATPNGDLGADTMTDDIIHELSETVTDPDISAWYTQSGAENGDLCNYVYGTVYTGVNSQGQTYHYNALLPTGKRNSTRPYLIQQIWKNVGAGACSSN